MLKVNNKEESKTSTEFLLLTLLLTLSLLVSLLLTSNIFQTLHDVKYAEIRSLYGKKRKNSHKFYRLQYEVFFLPNKSPPHKSPQSIQSWSQRYSHSLVPPSPPLESCVFCSRHVVHFKPTL